MKHIRIENSSFPVEEYTSAANFIPNEYKSVHNGVMFFTGMNGWYTSTSHNNRARMIAVSFGDGKIYIYMRQMELDCG